MRNTDVTFVSPTACFIQTVQGWFRLYPRIYISFSQSMFRGSLRFLWNIFKVANFFLSPALAFTNNFVIYSDSTTCVLYRPFRQSGSYLEWQRLETAELTFGVCFRFP